MGSPTAKYGPWLQMLALHQRGLMKMKMQCRYLGDEDGLFGALLKEES
jgi:hypothetical protein